MARTILHRAMQVGRAAVFTAGMAMILALLFGVATTALGATGGNFILGKANVADTVSKLTAGISGSTLQVINNGAGTALDLRVGSSTTAPADKTVAPMKVDSQARVANLNADEVDGKDASSFAPSVHTHPGEDITSGTVAEARIDDSLTRDDEVMSRVQAADGAGSGLDADQVDGKDSSAFLLVNGKARDSAHADQADSATTAQNADRLDGKDSGEFIQGRGTARHNAVAIAPGNNIWFWQLGDPGLWFSYECRSELAVNGFVGIKNVSTSETVNVFSDNGSTDPSYRQLAPNEFYSQGASAAGEHITFQVQGTYIATIEVFSVHRTSDNRCHVQAQALITKP
jgi:hypothetical protein